MSLGNPSSPRTNLPIQSDRFTRSTRDETNFPLYDAVKAVEERVAPVWPLNDYVAVNPYKGFSEIEFLTTRDYLRTLSDVEFFMPVDYYRQQYSAGLIHRAEIAAAVDELVADGVAGAERIDVNQVVAFLKEQSNPSPTSDAEFTKPSNPNRMLRTALETADLHDNTSWGRLVEEEISKHCSTHYDQGQSSWNSATRDLSLFAAWRSEKLHDRTLEIMGVSGFRRFVGQLPHQPLAAIAALLHELKLPSSMWEDYLLSTALMNPGWSAWTKYCQQADSRDGVESTDFVSLLAIRLAYEVAITRHLAFQIDWHSIAVRFASHREWNSLPTDEDLLRYALLRASEIAFRSRLLPRLNRDQASVEEPVGAKPMTRKLAQLVFCIDVRSERIRRHLENTSPDLQTYGFAGFFGLPIEYVPLGAEKGDPNVPALISPQFCVHEEVRSLDETAATDATHRVGTFKFLRKAWKEFQSSAVSMFAFVETSGLYFAWRLFSRSMGWSQAARKLDGLSHQERMSAGPSLDGLCEQGVDLDKQVELAESMLRGIGIVDRFARLVVFCGHGSEVENNPLKAGLDCGACGGHTGEANARVAAKLLNEPPVRAGLASSGIHIPDDTVFVAALHNTTTDQLDVFDLDAVPPSHHKDLEELTTRASIATAHTRQERLLSLPGPDAGDLDRRSGDWSEVRPEWGLAGNAAFIVGPRELTSSISLQGRAFLHSYDFQQDPGFRVLEQIMTAPMAVANWINLQYYASTVDPIHFGSGNKTVHNVVGQFGILSGNSGDLMTGLPWQSVHDGTEYQHHPLRLLVVIAAPRSAIETILERHPDVANLVINGWLQLLAFDESSYYRFTERRSWEEVIHQSVAAQ